jgi:hypothetical protein
MLYNVLGSVLAGGFLGLLTGCALTMAAHDGALKRDPLIPTGIVMGILLGVLSEMS